MAKISTIIPIYKVEKYLQRCVDSVLSQTFTDFEGILVDDGTPDFAGGMADEYALFDSRIISIHKPNEGVSVARNTGTILSKAQYVTYVDSDDWIDIKMLSAMWESVLSTNAELVICGYNDVDPDFNIVDSYVPERKVYNNIDALNFFGELGNPVFFAPWCKLIRRNIALSNLFPVGRRYSEDKATVYKWMFASNKISAECIAGYQYFYSITGICRNKNIPFEDEIATNNELIKFCRFNKLYELEQHVISMRIDADVYILNWISNTNTRKKIMRDLRCQLILNAKKIGYSPKSQLEIFEIAFPLEMKVYCHWKAFIIMLKSKGIKAVLRRILLNGKN